MLLLEDGQYRAVFTNPCNIIIDEKHFKLCIKLQQALGKASSNA